MRKSTFESGADIAEFLDTFRYYVRAPLIGARRAIEREQDEVQTEIDAFDAFSERLATVDIPQNHTGQPLPPTVARGESGSNPLEAIRTAYQETVLAVDHFDQAYDESLEEHFTNEFGPDIGWNLTAERASPLPPQYLDAVRAASEEAIRARQNYLELFEDEYASIDRADAVITDLVDECSETQIPEWYQEEFRDQLSELTDARQEKIQTYDSDSNADGHVLCSYLYDDVESTYPVLAAIGRLRSIVQL